MRTPWGRESGWSDQRGAVLVELSFAIVLLLLLIFGIVTFGVIFSFKQGMTQAAAEGARAAAIAPVGTASTAGLAAAEGSVDAFDQDCNVAALSCNVTVAPCPNAPTSECVTVDLIYDYDSEPLLPPLPLLSTLLPSSLQSSSVAQVNS
jgi:Flp pilus assembly protein TadG